MTIFSFTQKLALDKLTPNTDCLFFTSEAIDNPWLVSEQHNYTHYSGFKGTSIAVVADGLFDNNISKLTLDVYNKEFINVLDLISEQEVLSWLMDVFVRLELRAAGEMQSKKNLSTSGASIAGVLIHSDAGVFIFNAGDCKVFSINSSCAKQMTTEHARLGVLENYAGVGGHYLSVSGGIRDTSLSYFIATRNLCEALADSQYGLEQVVYDIMSIKQPEAILEALKGLTKDVVSAVSAVGILSN